MERSAKQTEIGSSPDPSLPPYLKVGGPQYLHLLCAEDLLSIRPYLGALLAQLEDLLEHSQELYESHFGETRSLSNSIFCEIYRNALTRGLTALVNDTMSDYVRDVWRLGEHLAQRGVPFPELVAIQHFINQSALPILMSESSAFSMTNIEAFDKLNQVRTIVLAEAYFRGKFANFGTRLQALKSEATRIDTRTCTRFHGLIGSSPPMRQLYEVITAASHSSIVLVCGESGTGKELVARAIHEIGSPSRAPFVAINCAAIPKDLIESELFGYKKGAFSGATEDHLGVFQAAQGGTVFLDEVTEMSHDAQTKLLRATQEWAVRPVGSLREFPVNLRVIASTNRDPEEAVRDGLLRHDLYYRLQACVIDIPPLRERLPDIPLLVEHFIHLFSLKLTRRVPVSDIEPTALSAMESYGWPGNVRELSNAIQRAFIFGRFPSIRLEDLPPTILRGEIENSPTVDSGDINSLVRVERELIKKTLELTGGNKSRAAELLGISRKKLYTKMAQVGLDDKSS